MRFFGSLREAILAAFYDEVRSKAEVRERQWIEAHRGENDEVHARVQSGLFLIGGALVGIVLGVLLGGSEYFRLVVAASLLAAVGVGALFSGIALDRIVNMRQTYLLALKEETLVRVVKHILAAAERLGGQGPT